MFIYPRPHVYLIKLSYKGKYEWIKFGYSSYHPKVRILDHRIGPYKIEMVHVKFKKHIYEAVRAEKFIKEEIKKTSLKNYGEWIRYSPGRFKTISGIFKKRQPNMRN